ncbi:ankyrin repeat domain-containing protein 35 isoform X2 [Spea bombifrons]|uniref:ankyrin repeat domain-containing protein 35 isoform X2 n=1 Tax=Spea bombifrons TaxID=233779 RepID=UPI002349CAD5|nr:ankyrin repeat domain-containing protein 35 isoform X2 [Spea bombifrons]
MVGEQSAMKRWQSLFVKQTYKPSAVDKWMRHDQKLFEAVEKGDAKKVSSLLSKKLIRATKASPKGLSAFHLAAAKGLTDCLNVILSHKVEINAKTDDGYTALHLAANNCHPDCVKILLQRGAHEDSIDFRSQTPLHCAASSGCVSSTSLLCDAEDTILDAADDDGRTPLMIAAQRNHPMVCSLLLDRGAQIDLTEREKKTALILACEKGNLQAAETLVSKGADPRPKDNRGCDALAYASQARDESLKKLVQAALDRRKSGEGSQEESASACKVPPQTNLREQELLNMWKRRYEEEQKRGLWLQGDLMMKTQELESIMEESQLEKTRLKKLVEELSGLLDGQAERQGATGQESYPPDPCGLLNRVLEQVKNANEHQQKERRRHEDAVKMLRERITEVEQQQTHHQEEVKNLQVATTAAKENEESARQRVAELEGHLENMREVLSQFEKRKRIQSTVVEDLEEEISEITQEKEELLVLLQKLQGQEDVLIDTRTDTRNNDQVVMQNNIKALKELVQTLQSDSTNRHTKTADALGGSEAFKNGSGLVSLDALEKNEGNWEKIIRTIEKYLDNIERAQQNLVLSTSERRDSGLVMNGSVGEHKTENNMEGLNHQKKVETSVPCLQSELIQPSDNRTVGNESTAPGISKTLSSPSTQGSEQAGADTIHSLRQNVSELQFELSSLKATHSNLLTQMNHASQEKHNLEEGLLALQERLQAEYALRQEMDNLCKDYKQQVLLLSDELLAEQGKLQKLTSRLESQENEMLMLKDSFPPEILREGTNKRGELFQSDTLEELYWNVGTLVMKYNEALQLKAALQKENHKLLENQAQNISITDHNNILNEVTNKLDTQVKETEMLKQRLFQAMGSIVELRDQLTSQASSSLSRVEHDNKMADVQRTVESLKEENDAYKVNLEKKGEEVTMLKKQLEQKAVEEQILRSREAERIQEYERHMKTLEVRITALSEDVQILSGKLMDASKESMHLRDELTSEKERSTHLGERRKELETERDALRIETRKHEEENSRLNEKCDEHCRGSQEKQEKIEELLKELDSMTKETVEQQMKCEDLMAQLEDTNKRHQEIISIYRTHLLHAAQGFMDKDVHLTLHWILKMQNDIY